MLSWRMPKQSEKIHILLSFILYNAAICIEGIFFISNSLIFLSHIAICRISELNTLNPVVNDKASVEVKVEKTVEEEACLASGILTTGEQPKREQMTRAARSGKVTVGSMEVKIEGELNKESMPTTGIDKSDEELS